MRRRLEPELGVGLVAREQEAVLARKLGGPQEEVERGHRTGRVVRIVEPDDRGTLPGLLGNSLEIGQKAGLVERQLLDLRAGERRAAVGDRITGLRRDDERPVAVAVDHHLGEQEDRLLRAVCRDDLRGWVEAHAEAPLAPAGDRLPQLWQSLRERVGRDLRQALGQRPADHRVGRLARIALAEVDQLDARRREPALRLLELDERIGACGRECG